MVEITDANSFFTASIWNLEISYGFISHFVCALMLDIMALEFVKAVFPVILIETTFILVKLHDNNVVWGWKLLKRLRRRNAKTSLIEVFASFIFLSSGPLLLTLVYFLVYTISFSQLLQQL
jgi:hypothetical protein